MRTKYHQISLKDTFSDCQEMFQDDTLSFFKLLGNTLDISEFIPANPFPCPLPGIARFLRLF